MTRPEKKADERLVLRDFLKSMSLDADIIEGEFESPDQVIRLGDKTIGVELTEIQKSDKERAHYELIERILRSAKKICDESLNQKRNVTVSFVQNRDLRAVSRERIAAALVERVSAEPPSDEVQCLSARQMRGPLLGFISSIYFFNSSGPGSVWKPSNGTHVADLADGTLQARIDAKSAHIERYRQNNYDEYWLLVHAGPLNPSQRFDVSVHFDPGAMVSSFDRTFFFDYWQTIEVAKRSVGP